MPNKTENNYSYFNELPPALNYKIYSTYNFSAINLISLPSKPLFRLLIKNLLFSDLSPIWICSEPFQKLSTFFVGFDPLSLWQNSFFHSFKDIHSGLIYRLLFTISFGRPSSTFAAQTLRRRQTTVLWFMSLSLCPNSRFDKRNTNRHSDTKKDKENQKWKWIEGGSADRL